jgi:ABC-type nitrate/sulfonate/bicarbonate transport system substrate-binding protein
MRTVAAISPAADALTLTRRQALASLAAGALVGSTAQAQDLVNLKVVVFPGGFNWPLWVAQAKGMLAQRGLTVQVTPTPNSTFQMKGLIDGEFDIAMTAFDNVVAYNNGQGEATTERRADLAAFLGADGGFLRLVAGSGITSIEQLKGRKLAVDALTTGYAFVLREMLARRGLRPEDVEFVRAGGVSQRFAGLLRNEFDATLLVSPFETQALARGYNLLARAPDILDAYQGVVGAARLEWLATHQREAAGYAAALAVAVDWLLAPANREEALAILRTNLPQLTDEAAHATYVSLISAPDGFQQGAMASPAGLRTVLQLRAKFAGGPEGAGGVERHYDARVLQSAVGSRLGA